MKKRNVLSFSRDLSIVALLGGLVPLAFGQVALAQDIPQSDRQDTTVSDESRTADWRTLVPNVLNDQRRMFGTFPAELAHGKHWLPVLAVAAATTGLIIADQYDAGYFRRTTSLNRFNSAFSSENTAAGTVFAPVALYSAGYFFKDDYAKETALLSGEAALDGEIVDTVMKVVSDRLRPGAIPVSGNFADSFVEGKSRLNGSFPSGHTVAAFSVATIISRRYGRRHKWVPLVAYGLSAAVGFSRVSLSAHFASDVFFGAAVGYGIGRFAVLHE